MRFFRILMSIELAVLALLSSGVECAVYLSGAVIISVIDDLIEKIKEIA